MNPTRIIAMLCLGVVGMATLLPAADDGALPVVPPATTAPAAVAPRAEHPVPAVKSATGLRKKHPIRKKVVKKKTRQVHKTAAVSSSPAR